MGKHEVGTPKYIANKIKAKGLQKLRWFCQMCEKQCRDENGFKCHTMSESHHRQLLLFADNQHKYMDEFSREFSQGYINLLKRQFGTRRTPANRVYQEYIADRGHVHMNATIWLSLTAFVKWLGRSGKCVVDETEKGWFVTYVDRDPETLALQEKKAKKQKMDKDDQERMMDFIEKQVEKGRQETFDPSGEFKVPLTRAQDDAPLVFELKSKPKPMAAISSGLSQKSSSSTKKMIKTEPLSDAEGDAEDSPKGSTLNFDESFSRTKRESSQKRYNNDEESSYAGKRKKSKKNDSDEERKAAGKEKRGWLWEGLTVKIITDSLGDKYYKAKGQIVEIAENGFVAKLKIKNPESVEGHCLRLDQAHLETVLPAIGKQVLIVQGKYTGLRAVLRKVRIDEFAVDVELCDDDKIVKRLSYESVCKYEKMR